MNKNTNKTGEFNYSHHRNRRVPPITETQEGKVIFIFRFCLRPHTPNMSAETITTPLTKLFGIKHPILLAGMNVAAGPELAAAVTNAGGLGVIGGVGKIQMFDDSKMI